MIWACSRWAPAGRILALDAAAAFCSGDLAGEISEERILEASDRLQSRSAMLGDEGLGIESALMAKPLDNVQGGSVNCANVDGGDTDQL